MKEFVVLEEISGVSKKNNPYHMVKFACPVTFANHTLSVDSSFIGQPLGLQKGQRVTFETDFRTDFRGTNTVITKVNVVK